MKIYLLKIAGNHDIYVPTPTSCLQVVWKSEPNAQEHRTRDPTLTENANKMCDVLLRVAAAFASLNTVRNVFFPLQLNMAMENLSNMYVYLQ